MNPATRHSQTPNAPVREAVASILRRTPGWISVTDLARDLGLPVGAVRAVLVSLAAERLVNRSVVWVGPKVSVQWQWHHDYQ